MKKLFLYSLFAAVLPISIMAQSTGKETKAAKKTAAKARTEKIKNQEEEGALVYQKQIVFGLKLNTDGYGIFFEKSKLKTAEKASFYSIELSERKDGKEQKLTDNSTFFSTGNSLIYGKINNFYYLKLGIGQSLLLGGKGDHNGVAVSFVYGGGLSLGLLKPYYLDITTPRGDSSIRYMDNNSSYDSLYTSLGSANARVNGNSGFFKGLGDIKIKPGLYAKTSLRFDYGKYNEVVSALEVGLGAEYYFSQMPLLLYAPHHQFFINAFVAIEFGKRK